jgi:hypothetical protein
VEESSNIMYLDLIDDRRPHLRITFHSLDLALAEIAHANCLDLAFQVCFLQRLPHALHGFWPSVRAVDEE